MARKNKGGRPTKYFTHVEPRLIEVEGWARDGLSDEQIAKNLGVAYSTFKTYKQKYSALSAALAKNKAIADREVENALFKKATGYERKLTQQKITKDGEIIEYEQTIYIQPDVTAQKFWLVNRKPEMWSDKQDLDIKGDMDVNKNPFKDLSTEELRKLAKMGDKK